MAQNFKGVDKTKTTKTAKEVVKRNIVKNTDSHDKRITIRCNAFHRDLAKFSAMQMKDPKMNMETYINFCIEKYSSENFPDIYRIIKRNHGIK